MESAIAQISARNQVPSRRTTRETFWPATPAGVPGTLLCDVNISLNSHGTTTYHCTKPNATVSNGASESSGSPSTRTGNTGGKKFASIPAGYDINATTTIGQSVPSGSTA